MRPTTWSAWPTSGAEWRDIYNPTVDSRGPQNQMMMPELQSMSAEQSRPTQLSSDEGPLHQAARLPQNIVPKSPPLQPTIIVHQSELLPPVIVQQSAIVPLTAPSPALAPVPVRPTPKAEISLPTIEAQPLLPIPSPTARPATSRSERPEKFQHLDFGSKSEFEM
jgi:hypothetical protein